MFFLFLLVIHNNPFETFLATRPAAGEGLNPLLQNFYMTIHPPTLYLGFVGMTIPFAFGIAALVTGQLDDSWLRAVRRWTMSAWLFLTLGLALGSLWAYEELGWGGIWFWDPVENAALLPWFTATAFLHSVMVQERRGMMKVWNVSLVIVTFFLTIFGTFMTRSGIVQSVHAFGEDRELAWMFTIFMVSLVTVSFALVVYRMPLLRARNELDSWLSREAAFLANNWVLLFCAFFVLFATMFPTLSEALRGERLTVGAPFYNKWMAPVGMILLFLTGLGPLLAWRKSSVANLRQQLLWPVAAGVASGTGTTVIGIPFWPSGACIALCAYVATTVFQEFWRGAAVRRQTTGTDRFTALVGLFARSRRRYAGYVIHLGIALIFIGFAGTGFGREETANLEPGQQVELSPYTVRHLELSVTDDGRKQMVTAHVEVLQNGASLGRMYPARWFWRGREEEPTTEIALRRGLAGDLYINLAQYEPATQHATLEVKINPLVNWIWFGVGVIFLGTCIALLPDRALAFAAARVPEGAVTTTMVLILAAVFGTASLHAQHIVPSQTVSVVPRTPLERRLQHEIVCMCGTCGRKRVGECTCLKASQMREEIARLTGEGKTYDEIIQYYVAQYGSQEVLAAPLNEGFNRLAWFLPYAVGAAGVGIIGVLAVRWTRRGRMTPGGAAAVTPARDTALAQRLDDELRDLD
jgi:cytochrome c-type biogenesis protein CcmF